MFIMVMGKFSNLIRKVYLLDNNNNINYIISYILDNKAIDIISIEKVERL